MNIAERNLPLTPANGTPPHRPTFDMRLSSIEAGWGEL
jgi:hypothetical protein